jgi:gliding motility-associated-like protein
MNGNSITMDAAPMEASGIYEAFTLFEGCPSEMVSGALDIIALPEEIIETFENISVERCPEMNPLLNLPQFDSAYSASWNSTDSDGNTTYFGEGPAIVAAGVGAYSVYLTTGAPCLLEASGNFDVETVLCDLLVPNVFSPNQDGSNERFALPDLSYFPNSTCAIYNRWGQVVFESQDFGNSAGWLPTPDEAVDGTYYYVIRINRSEGDLTIIDENGSSTYTEPGTIELKGSLTLIR